MKVLYEKYSIDKLMILAFPCNNFGGQEPGSHAEIQDYVRNKLGYQGPLFGKMECDNAAATHPLFKELMGSLDNGVFGQGLKWNFAKFLCNSEGVPVKRFSSMSSPLSFENEILELINAPGPASTTRPAIPAGLEGTNANVTPAEVTKAEAPQGECKK